MQIFPPRRYIRILMWSVCARCTIKRTHGLRKENTYDKSEQEKSSGSKYAVLILTAVIAIVAIGCGLFYATSNSKKDVLDKKGDEPQTVSLLDESIEAQRLLDNILLQKIIGS